jgi:tRNA pseudouridine38-40 synthase
LSDNNAGRSAATYRLTVEYEGTRYRGWQEQKNARTVAGELRGALERASAQRLELGGAGRTDAGVHALGQVAHARFERRVEPERLRGAANDLLPADIHILSLEEAPPRFHARHHATARVYLYQIARRRTALAKRFVWWVRRPLELEPMAAALGAVVGRHDFARFAERASDPAASTLVVVESAELAPAGDLVLVRLVASHFLWKMVRRLVGALVEVGAGALTPEGFAGLLDGAPAPGGPSPAEWTAPPSGLFLERVLYPGDPPPPPLAPATPVEPAPRAARAAASPPAPRPRPRPGRPSAPGRRGRGAGPGRRGGRAPR